MVLYGSLSHNHRHKQSQCVCRSKYYLSAGTERTTPGFELLSVGICFITYLYACVSFMCVEGRCVCVLVCCRDGEIRVFEVPWVVRVLVCLCMFLNLCVHFQLCVCVCGFCIRSCVRTARACVCVCV